MCEGKVLVGWDGRGGARGFGSEALVQQVVVGGSESII